MTQIDEGALALVQNAYADEHGKYKDMSIRTTVEAYLAAHPKVKLEECAIDMDWEQHFFVEIKGGVVTQYANASMYELIRVK